MCLRALEYCFTFYGLLNVISVIIEEESLLPRSSGTMALGYVVTLNGVVREICGKLII